MRRGIQAFPIRIKGGDGLPFRGPEKFSNLLIVKWPVGVFAFNLAPTMRMIHLVDSAAPALDYNRKLAPKRFNPGLHLVENRLKVAAV
ncbi:hypothetical protein [Aestuariivirga litoralis]|uniref:hypothetical protein n=1 Tax=Aestuariivirga litoralis TaxID=2650924 RepID=UPI0018C4CE41|nr:hypothetical protein [Aestuariivirga litoralis]MBG1233232.1 hypothetical protein [Aestuariivirga litoralis]